jgi:hypothetical protein
MTDGIGTSGRYFTWILLGSQAKMYTYSGKKRWIRRRKPPKCKQCRMAKDDLGKAQAG